MWIVLAAVSAISAGFVSITVKAGMKNVDSGLGTFLSILISVIFSYFLFKERLTARAWIGLALLTGGTLLLLIQIPK